MENFSQWLESISYQRYAPLFATHGHTTFAKFAHLTEAELTTMGVSNDTHRRNLLDWAGSLQGRPEADIIRDIPVSVLHTEFYIISSNLLPKKDKYN